MREMDLNGFVKNRNFAENRVPKKNFFAKHLQKPVVCFSTKTMIKRGFCVLEFCFSLLIRSFNVMLDPRGVHNNNESWKRHEIKF